MHVTEISSEKMENINRWANLSQFDSCGCQKLLFELWRLKRKNGHISRDKMHFLWGHFWEYKWLKLQWAYVTDISFKKTKNLTKGLTCHNLVVYGVKCQFLNLRSAILINFFFFQMMYSIMDEIYILKNIYEIVTYHAMKIWKAMHFPLNFWGLNAIKVTRSEYLVASDHTLSFLTVSQSISLSLPHFHFLVLKVVGRR